MLFAQRQQQQQQQQQHSAAATGSIDGSIPMVKC
jgi:hypothetical protein